MKKHLLVLFAVFMLFVLCTVSVGADAVFTFSSGEVNPGDTLQVKITLKSSEAINSIALSDFSYDEDILTFTGFSDYDEIDALTLLPPTFNDEKMAAVVALKKAQAYDGSVCTLNFKVANDAPAGSVSITASAITKNNSTQITASVVPASITIKGSAPEPVCALGELTLLDMAGNTIDTIPNGSFMVEVPATNISHSGKATVVFAAYDKDGRLLELRYVYCVPPTGLTLTFGTSFPNASGSIKMLKVYIWDTLTDMKPLCETKGIGA